MQKALPFFIFKKVKDTKSYCLNLESKKKKDISIPQTVTYLEVLPALITSRLQHINPFCNTKDGICGITGWLASNHGHVPVVIKRENKKLLHSSA